MEYSKKEVVSEAVVAFLIVGVLVGGVVFFEARARKAGTVLENMRNDASRILEDVKYMSEAQMQYNQYGERYLNVLYNIVPKKDELINLSKEIRTTIGVGDVEYGFSFLGERPPSYSGELGAVQFGVNLSVNSEEDVLEMIRRLQSMRFLTNFDDFSVVKSEEGSFSISTKGEVFYRDNESIEL